MSLAEQTRTLTTGAVRGWHIALLYTMIWCSMVVASAKITPATDPLLREDLRYVVMQALTAGLVVLVTLIVPELRRSIRALYARQARGLEVLDVALFASLMLTWALGAHRILVYFPLLQWDPSLFTKLGFHERLPAFDSLRLFLFLIVGSVIAPLAEELVFRGFLFNLWMHRWGLVPGIVLSSAFFGLFHSSAFLMAMVAGIFLSLVYLRFASLWPGTLLHALHNLVAGPLGMTLFVQKSRVEAVSLSGWIPELILAIAFVPLLVLFWRRFRPVG